MQDKAVSFTSSIIAVIQSVICITGKNFSHALETGDVNKDWRFKAKDRIKDFFFCAVAIDFWKTKHHNE